MIKVVVVIVVIEGDIAVVRGRQFGIEVLVRVRGVFRSEGCMSTTGEHAQFSTCFHFCGAFELWDELDLFCGWFWGVVLVYIGAGGIGVEGEACGFWLDETGPAPGSGCATTGDAHAECTRAVAHDGLVVPDGGSGCGLGLIIGYGWTGGVLELWPASGVGERGSEDVRV